MIHCYASKVSLITVRTQPVIQYVGNICGETGVGIQGRSVSWERRFGQESTLLFR